MIKQLEKIRKTSVFKGINEEDFQMILESLDSQLKNYAPNQTIFKAGNRVKRAAILIEGNIELYKKNYWGEPQEVYEIGAGELFAISLASSTKLLADISAISTTNSVVLWFNIQDLFTLSNLTASHMKVIKNIMATLAKQNVDLNAKLLHLTRKNTREKILSYLSTQAIINGSNEFDIPYNRQELANYLALERSAMSTELNKLQKEGYFESKHNHFLLKKKG